MYFILLHPRTYETSHTTEKKKLNIFSPRNKRNRAVDRHFLIHSDISLRCRDTKTQSFLLKQITNGLAASYIFFLEMRLSLA